MDSTFFPTKGNLIIVKNTLKLSKQGYDLMDKKRNVLVREMMALIERAKDIQGRIDKTFADAYIALQNANITMGIKSVQNISETVPIEQNVKINFRSIMGVELPTVTLLEEAEESEESELGKINSALDEAYIKFKEIKQLVALLAEVENSVYRLAVNIQKAQKRANSLENVMIPKYEGIVKNIQDVLEEREREEFARLKLIKMKNTED